MRAILGLALAGCNALLGVHDFAPTDPCSGVCECRVDLDCSDPHAVCLDQTTSRTCACAAGYASAGGTCTWSGIVADPGFVDPAKWTVSGKATIVPSFVGVLDPGAAQITLETTCPFDTDGRVSQQVTMPRRSRSESLVFTSEYLVTAPGDVSGAAFSIGSVWTQRLPTPNTWTPERRCLGGRQYAPESSTGVGAATSIIATIDDGCDSGLLNVDRFDIVPANLNECPDPGTVANGDAEGEGGWVFSTPSPADVATIAPGVGEAGTRGVRLVANAACDMVTGTVLVSVPVTDEHGSAVLSIYHSTSASYLGVTLDGVKLALTGTQPGVDRFCVPAHLRGAVVPLQARVYQFAAGCGAPVSLEADLDNVTVSNDPGCGDDPAIADPGFEANLSLVGAQLIGGATAVSTLDAAAHGGQRDLQLTVPNCAIAKLELDVVHPDLGAVSPALGFWYRAPAGVNMQVIPMSGFAPIYDGQWHADRICLGHIGGDRPMTVDFLVTNTTATSCGTGGITVALDDLSITSVLGCP